jgi:hypothetical protein
MNQSNIGQVSFFVGLYGLRDVLTRRLPQRAAVRLMRVEPLVQAFGLMADQPVLRSDIACCELATDQIGNTMDD